MTIGERIKTSPVAASLRSMRETVLFERSPLYAIAYTMTGLNRILNGGSNQRMRDRGTRYLNEIKEDSTRTNDLALHFLSHSVLTGAVFLMESAKIAITEPLILASSFAVGAAVAVKSLTDNVATTATSLQNRL
ncbi:MAG TPA: hypothetical protein VN711_04075 [Candidatus Saccharimonadales bacterium]|nr:hypothetical protein [Candidatus Saccharimonadales bacterium]